MKETGQRISSSTKETGQRVSSSVKEAGEHISASVKEAGERISSSAKVTGQRVSSSVKEAGERVESSAKETAERVRTSAKESGERVRASAKETGERMSAGYGKFRKIAAGKLRYLTARLRPGRKTLAPPPPWVRFLLAACTAASLGLNMGYPKYDALPEVVWNLLYSVSEKTFVPLLISILALYRYVDANRDLAGRPRLLTFLNAFIAAVWLMAEGFRAEGGVEILFATPGQCVKSAVYAVGVFAGLNALSEALVAVLGNRNSAVLTGSALTGGVPAPNASSGGSVRFRALRERWNRRPFGIYFVTLLLLWTPHLIASYPGNPTPSAYNQIAQVFGVMPWTNFHPPFSTLILGSIVKLGSYVSGNFGLFLYTLTQAVVFAAVLGWQSCLLRDLDAPIVLRRLVFAACALSPYYTSYITVLLKDNFYSYCFLLYVIELIYMAYLGGRYYKSLRHLFLLTVGEMGVILLRHNGKYVVYPVLILAVWNVLRALTRSPFRQRGEGRYAAAMALCMALPVAAAFVVSDSLSFDNPIAVGSVREALSLPFQQTARYVRDFGDEVTPAERRAIDAVLDYEHLAENYRPRLADPVKDTYREEADGEDLANYFLVWLVQFYKHPSVYFLATIQQNYYIVYPFVPNDAIFSGLDYPDQERITKPLGVHPVESLAACHRDMDRWYHMCFQIPGLNLLCHLATYVLVFLWLWLYAWKRKLREWTIPAFPVLLSLAVVIAAPVIQGHPRYAFPILYSVPALTAFWSYLARRQGEGESTGETGIAGGVSGGAIAGSTSGTEIPDGFGGQSESEIVSDVPENPDAVPDRTVDGEAPSEGLNNELNNALSDSEP